MSRWEFLAEVIVVLAVPIVLLVVLLTLAVVYE